MVGEFWKAEQLGRRERAREHTLDSERVWVETEPSQVLAWSGIYLCRQLGFSPRYYIPNRKRQ